GRPPARHPPPHNLKCVRCALNAVSPHQTRLLCFLTLNVSGQRGNERFLWHLASAHHFHAFFTLFLFFEQFTFTADVTAVTFGQHIFTNRANGFTSDDP